MTVYQIDKRCGVYKITHIRTGRVYVGSAVNLQRRIYDHKNALKRGVHKNPKLQRAWAKYGPSEFGFEVLEVCDREHLVTREQFYMDSMNVVKRGFNVMPFAATTFGFKHRAETIKKIAKANTGKRHSHETRARMKGRVVSKETRAALSQSHQGLRHSEATKRRMSVAQRQRSPVTEETKARISEALRLAHARRRAAKEIAS